jgi:Flp pilus assembly pilin Flp
VAEIVARLVAALQRRRQDGQAMVEYALILALVSVVSIIVLTGMGLNVNTVFEWVNNTLANAIPA